MVISHLQKKMMQILRAQLKPFIASFCLCRKFSDSIYSNITPRIKKNKLVITQISQVAWEFAHIRDLTRAQYQKAVDSLDKSNNSFRNCPFVILDVRDPDENTYEPLPAKNSVPILSSGNSFTKTKNP